MYHNKKSNKLAFTLVELIVVIVILAILATIAFISFGSQSASARDSTRLSDLWQIWKALWVKSVSAWSYPLPDKYVNILNGTWIVWYQWEVWDSVKRQLSIWLENFKDPSDKVNYSYTVNSAKHKFQILAFLESQSSSALNFGIQSDSASATSYTSRYPYARGDNLWVILVSTGNAWLPTYTPIQDVTPGNLWVTASWVDLSSGTVVSAWVTAFVSNDLSKNSVSLLDVSKYYTNTDIYYVGSKNANTNWLVLYYDMETLRSWKIRDLSWNWNDWIIAWTSLTTWPKWKARIYNWTADLITVPDSNTLDMTWSMSISMWIKPSQLPQNLTDHKWLIIKRDATTLDNFWILLHWNIWWKINMQTYNSTWYWTSSTFIPTVNTWYNIVYVYNFTDKTMKLYSNWVLDATYSWPNNLVPNNSPIYIWWYDWVGIFKWSIWEVAIYNRSLSSTEITDYYNLTK